MHYLICIAILLAGLARQESELTLLLVGDEAPPLHLVSAEEKQPVEFEEQAPRPTAVLFWATWSPQGREALAQLAALQERAGAESLRAIAVTTEPRGRVTAYMELHAGAFGEVELAVDRERRTFTAYMLSAVEKDVPQIFLIDREGRVAWIGHPFDGFHTAVEAFLAGDWSLEAHRRARLLLLQARKAALAGDRETLITVTHELSQVSPVYASYGVYHISLIAGDPERTKEAWVKGRALLEKYPLRADVANALAWFILDTEDLPGRDLELALAAARQANEQTEPVNPRYLHTLARAHFESDQFKEAVEAQTRAIEVAEATGAAALLDDLRQALRRYTAALQRAERRDPKGD